MSHWGAIHVPNHQLADYGRVLSGAGFVVPPVARWRPRRAAVRQLRDLHRAASRMAEARAGALNDPQAAHGLEQQIIEALVECLTAGPVEEETRTAARHRAILAQFEDLLQSEPLLGIADICAALGVSERTLRECCNKHLGMAPNRYRRLRGMQLVHRALRSGSPVASSVTAVARRYGFRDLGRFAANYQALLGELPSVTLRRGSHRGVTALTLGPPRIKLS